MVLVFFLLVILFFSMGQTFILAGDPPLLQVYLDGAILQFDVPPCFRQGVPLFPLRKIFEEIGYDVSWEADAQRAVLRGPDRLIVLYPQNPLYSVNGNVYRMVKPPLIEKGRIIVGVDFLLESKCFKDVALDESSGILCLEHADGKSGRLPSPSNGSGYPNEYQARFVEVLLPLGNRVEVGESFDIVITAPLVEDIYSYEIRFFYNPEIIKIKDIKNYSYKQQEDFYLKRINNREGSAEYALTVLGYREEMSSRSQLAVIEAIAFREGAVPFLETTLHVKLLDNTASLIPVALEEKTLYTGSGTLGKGI
ncbi:MAG: copper amine oxidase N-terminal domain-containing protein [Firmicutes bacterium]|nr:copper amine oxidase N-terminal domain-containing protein [Bacillota bacterium]